jgi:hypothetical protein
VKEFARKCDGPLGHHVMAHEENAVLQQEKDSALGMCSLEIFLGQRVCEILVFRI